LFLACMRVRLQWLLDIDAAAGDAHF
jgi:hypothetical protein